MMRKSSRGASRYDTIFLEAVKPQGEQAVNHYVLLINTYAISVCHNIDFTEVLLMIRMEGPAINTVILSVMQ